MTLTDHDLSELLAALKAGDITDPIRTSLEWVLQQLIEAEATVFIGAAPHERTETRTAQRNGHRARLLSTPAGDVELEIPKLRQGSFFPSLLERRRRIDRALFAVVMEAYVHGVSTRKVDDLVKALGVGSGISKSEVSRICAELDGDPQAFRDRPLDHTSFVYVFLDATYIQGRVRGRVVSRAVVIATCVTVTGDREGVRLWQNCCTVERLTHRSSVRGRGCGSPGRVGRAEAILRRYGGRKVALDRVFSIRNAKGLRFDWKADGNASPVILVASTVAADLGSAIEALRNGGVKIAPLPVPL